MPMDKTDYDLVRAVRDAVRDGNERTQNLLRRLNEQMEARADRERELIQAFSRAAVALEKMAGEIQGLREDLTPALEKPKALPAQKPHRPREKGAGA
jgi:chromosome segregation ATPase